MNAITNLFRLPDMMFAREVARLSFFFIDFAIPFKSDRLSIVERVILSSTSG